MRRIDEYFQKTSDGNGSSKPKGSKKKSSTKAASPEQSLVVTRLYQEIALKDQKLKEAESSLQSKTEEIGNLRKELSAVEERENEFRARMEEIKKEGDQV